MIEFWVAGALVTRDNCLEIILMRDIRISIAVITTLLISLGITMIYSSSGVYALGELGDKTYFVNRHLLFL